MFTKRLDQPSKFDVATAGGKGASLGEMIRSGIPVPPGFVVLSSAFEWFLDETNLGTKIDSILGSIKHGEIQSVDDASEKIKTLILETKCHKEIADEIQTSFNDLGAEFVAVRSSATAEDSASAAWAGQLESYLNTTKENLLENVKKCWASLFTPRAIFYRFEKRFRSKKISVAVVVQKMIQSEVSGICFTAHPVTKDRNQMVVEAGYGLGEMVVKGMITPDTYLLQKHTEESKILDKRISEQKIMLVFRRGKNEEITVSKEKKKKQKFSDQYILKLARLCSTIEKHFHTPQDIEWCFEKGKLFIVQSRPITTL